MTAHPDAWRQHLTQLFAASVNQQTLEEAAEMMVSVSSLDKGHHIECLDAIGKGIRAAEDGDKSLADIINKSGYKVSSAAEAASMLVDFRRVYLEEFERIGGGPQQCPVARTSRGATEVQAGNRPP